MTRIRIITSYRHKVGKLKELKQWLDTAGDQMIASACGPNERYIGIYMVEGDPSYTIELHTETEDPKVIEELDKLNTEQFDRGQTPLRILWRYLDPSFPPRVRFSRPLHESKAVSSRQ
jgi:hypothetical protein